MAEKKQPINPAKLRLNELGIRWKQYSPEEDSAAYESCWLEIWTALYEIYHPYLKSEADFEAFHGLVEETKRNFDPAKGSLSSYFTTRLSLRTSTREKKEQADNPVLRLSGESSEEKEGENKPSGTEAVDLKAERSLRAVEDSDTQSAALLELCSQILHFSENHNKKNGNKTRRNYFELFYTSSVTSYIKMEEQQPRFRHPRDIVGAMKLPFLDYCLADRCRSVADIYWSDMKRYGDVAEELPPSKQDKPIPLPIPNPVGRYYLMRIEGVPSVSEATYSGQKSAYLKEMKERLQEQGLLTRSAKPTER